jgi:ribose transport system substrate-binding protein
MKKLAWILAAFFGLIFLGATLLNADLVRKSREVLAAAGIGGSHDAPRARLHLLVILPASDDAYYSRLLEGVQNTAPDRDAAVQVERYSASSPEEAERWFDIGLRSKVDGIVMYAARDDDVTGRAARAEAAGVVFVAVGKEAPSGVLPCFIGTAPLFQGFEGGRLITGLLAQKARIGIILPTGGISAIPEDDSLYKGVAAAAATYPGAVILKTIRAAPGVFSGEEAAATLFAAAPDINAIFCATSRDTLGAAQVVMDRGLLGRVVIIGADETPELLQHIATGVVAASLVRDSRRIGEEAVLAFSSMERGSFPPGVIEVDFAVRTGKAAE